MGDGRQQGGGRRNGGGHVEEVKTLYPRQSDGRRSAGTKEQERNLKFLFIKIKPPHKPLKISYSSLGLCPKWKMKIKESENVIHYATEIELVYSN